MGEGELNVSVYGSGRALTFRYMGEGELNVSVYGSGRGLNLQIMGLLQFQLEGPQ